MPWCGASAYLWKFFDRVPGVHVLAAALRAGFPAKLAAAYRRRLGTLVYRLRPPAGLGAEHLRP
eukprot:8831861-Alexandrium_andersonii.AAC.1